MKALAAKAHAYHYRVISSSVFVDVSSLQQLIDFYMTPLQNSPQKYGVKSSLVDIVFANIVPIVTFHRIFLKDMVCLIESEAF